jgi:uncharacterized membrane protein HdeD (DUF308 family)
MAMVNEKRMPWWLMVITGLLIVAAGILLLASPDFLNVLVNLIGIGALILGLYFIFRAVRIKNENRNASMLFLVHGLLNIVLAVLIFILYNSGRSVTITSIGYQNGTLIGVMLGCWLIIFGVFGLIEARKTGGGKASYRISLLLAISGLVLLIVPFFLMPHYIFMGIIGIIIGVFRTGQGIAQKTRLDGRTSGGRSNLY